MYLYSHSSLTAMQHSLSLKHSQQTTVLLAVHVPLSQNHRYFQMKSHRVLNISFKHVQIHVVKRWLWVLGAGGGHQFWLGHPVPLLTPIYLATEGKLGSHSPASPGHTEMLAASTNSLLLQPSRVTNHDALLTASEANCNVSATIILILELGMSWWKGVHARNEVSVAF